MRQSRGWPRGHSVLAPSCILELCMEVRRLDFGVLKFTRGHESGPGALPSDFKEQG